MTTSYQLLTYQDVVEHVIDVFDLEASARSERNARKAILDAYRDFSNNRNWYRYQRGLRITTDAQQTTGTVTYVSATRLMTLADATWPANAIFGEVQIDTATYKPETYVSSTVLKMRADSCPTADISSATNYTWHRDKYALPDDFQSMGQMVDIANQRLLTILTIDDLITYKRTTRNHGVPEALAITALPEYGGGLAIQFVPTPSTARNYDAPYSASPRALRTKVYNTGTVSCTADSTAIVGSGTAFASLHAGAVLRISSDAIDYPTNMTGYSDGTQNPWAEQLVIKTVTDATNIVTEQPATQTLSACKYTISDPCDMDVGAMQDYFLRMVEARFSRLEARKDRQEREAAAEMARLDACQADRRLWNTLPGPRIFGPLRLGDVASRVNYS